MKKMFSLLLLAILLSSCAEPETFVIHRGTNIAHLLSQSQRRGEERRAFFTEKDVQRIAAMGFDHIRLPIDEVQMWNEQNEPEPEAFDLLDQAIGWCVDNDLRVIVDLHILRSHYFDAKVKPLFTDPAAREQFFQCWRDLSVRLQKWPVSHVAYELMNEPVADDAEDWNILVKKAVSVIRENEPERFIVIGSNRWQSPSTFDKLFLPEGDQNIILSFHFYTPMLITHYKASWNRVGDYNGAVNYPGQIISEDDFAGVDPSLQGTISHGLKVWNRDVFEKMMQKPIALAEKTGLRLYCGEWGALTTVPDGPRYAWYRDMISIFDQYDIAWANWNYKSGQFGIYRSADELDQPLADILLGKE